MVVSNPVFFAPMKGSGAHPPAQPDFEDEDDDEDEREKKRGVAAGS